MFDESRLPWTCEPDKSGAWAIIRDATGEFVGRVALRYGVAVAELPEAFKLLREVGEFSLGHSADTMGRISAVLCRVQTEEEK